MNVKITKIVAVPMVDYLMKKIRSFLLKRTTLSFVENIFNSIVSVVISLSIFKVWGVDKFAQYSISFAVLTFSMCITNALVNSHLAIYAPKLELKERKIFVSTFSLFFLVLAIFLSGFGFLILKLWPEISFAPYFSFFIFSYLLKEMLKVEMYSNECHVRYFISSLLILILISLNSLFMYYMKVDISYYILINSLLYVLLVCFASIKVIKNVNVKLFDLQTLRMHIKMNSYMLVGAILTWAQGNLFVIFSGVQFGNAVTAAYSATRMLMMPINITMNGIFSGLKSSFSKRIIKEKSVVFNQIDKMFNVIALLVLFYTGILFLMWQTIDAHLFNSEFYDYKILLVGWGGYFLFQCLRLKLSNYLSLQLRYKDITKFSVPIMAISIPMMYLGGQTGFYLSYLFIMLSAEILIYLSLKKEVSEND